jgi:thioredoxin-related protein
MPSIPLLLILLAATPAPSHPAPTVWSDNYTDALKATQETDKPLLVVIHDPANRKSCSQHATDRPDKTQAELLKNYELCRIDGTTEHGKQVAEAFRVESFPFMAVIDKSGSSVLCQYTGQLDVEQWVEKLVAHKNGETPAASVANTTLSSSNSSRTYQSRGRRGRSSSSSCYT